MLTTPFTRPLPTRPLPGAQYLLSVVKQLVQLAAVDDDLRTELDAVDGYGLSLLHYCCLYNLTALVRDHMAVGAPFVFCY